MSSWNMLLSKIVVLYHMDPFRRFFVMDVHLMVNWNALEKVLGAWFNWKVYSFCLYWGIGRMAGLELGGVVVSTS